MKMVYWTGDLFDCKDLLGNRMLADAINRQKGHQWKTVLPQENKLQYSHVEFSTGRSMHQRFPDEQIRSILGKRFQETV